MPRPNIAIITGTFYLVLLHHANAGITVGALDRGNYDDAGVHVSSNENYIAGEPSPLEERRSFFVFDLSGIVDTITVATLNLPNPLDPTAGFSSPDATETFTLFDVTTDIDVLIAGTPPANVTIFTDLGTGTVFGSTTVDRTATRSTSAGRSSCWRRSRMWDRRSSGGPATRPTAPTAWSR